MKDKQRKAMFAKMNNRSKFVDRERIIKNSVLNKSQKRRVVAVRSKPNSIAVVELDLYTANDREIYDSVLSPLRQNLVKKVDKGTYNSEKALLGFLRVANAGAKKYEKEFGDKNRIFTKADRLEVAKGIQERFEDHQGLR